MLSFTTSSTIHGGTLSVFLEVVAAIISISQVRLKLKEVTKLIQLNTTVIKRQVPVFPARARDFRAPTLNHQYQAACVGGLGNWNSYFKGQPHWLKSCPFKGKSALEPVRGKRGRSSSRLLTEWLRPSKFPAVSGFSFHLCKWTSGYVCRINQYSQGSCNVVPTDLVLGFTPG